MLKALGAMIASEHTSCICATVHVAFSLSAAVVRWQTSLTRQAGAYFHFSDSTSDCMHVAAPAATGSSFPTSEERDSNSCLLSTHRNSSCSSLHRSTTIHEREKRDVWDHTKMAHEYLQKKHGTTQKWHVSACKKVIWDYTNITHEGL